MQKQQEPKHIVPSTKRASWCATDWSCSFHWIYQSWLCLTWFLQCSWSQWSSKRTRNKTPRTWSLYSDENLEFPWLQLELLISVCYGSDEEQSRTIAVDAAEQNVIHRCCSKMKEREREMRKNAQNYVVHLWSYIHGRENRKLFITDAVYKWKLIPKKYKASLPYISRGQNRKNNRINFHMDLGHSPTKT